MSAEMYDSNVKIFTNTNAAIGSDSPESPDDETVKRVCFLVNNLSETNLLAQIEEIKSILPDCLIQWLAEFLVKRSGSEINLQPLYTMFIENLKASYCNLDELIIELLKSRCDYILKSAFVDTASIRLLKSYGTFLGYLTLARDVHICLDLKSLLKDSYQADRDSLDFLLPFVCHILRGLEFSKSITKHHPWAQEILAILKEIYDMTDKINVQFEIEILFKLLSISIVEVKPAFFMRLSSSIHSYQ